jgi:DNA-binding NtrC family response regulator
VEALKRGACDFVTKPFRIEELLTAVQRALEAKSPSRSESTGGAAGVGDAAFVANSPTMQRLVLLAARVARTDTTVLLLGESGVGKGALARFLHRHSRRSGGPFVMVNAAALPNSLAEAELFGVKKGAFTDAKESRPGLFQRAEGGTLFLDEVAELPLELQAKLLHALEERQVRPVGSATDVAIDCRIIAATNADLQAKVSAREFRPDLFYRLNVVKLEVPPLRQRLLDIPPLAEYFVSLAARRAGRGDVVISPDALRFLETQTWPGNVRELASAIERAVIFSDGPVLSVADFELLGEVLDPTPAPDEPEQQNPLSAAARAMLPLAQVEDRYIDEVLAQVGGNRSEAARRLGIDRRTLHRRLAERAVGGEDHD